MNSKYVSKVSIKNSREDVSKIHKEITYFCAVSCKILCHKMSKTIILALLLTKKIFFNYLISFICTDKK